MTARPRLLAAVAVLAAGMVAFAVPALSAATAVNNVTFSGSSVTAGATATWTVGFTTSGTGAIGNKKTVTITFASGFTLPASPPVTMSSSFGTGCNPTVGVSGTTATVTLGNACSLAAGTSATIALGGITNPTTAQTYANTSFSVATSSDTVPASPTSGVTITAAAAAKLSFTQAPTSATAGQAFSTQPVVSVLDQFGNVVTTSSAAVTLAVQSGQTVTCSAPGTTVNAVNGVATYSGCAMTTAGTFVLTASSGTLTPAQSGSLTVGAAAATKLGYIQQPSDAFAGSAMTPAVTVQLEDQYGNFASGVVTVTLTPSSGVIDSGATATTASNGRATFNAITINTAATGLTLTASAPSLASVVSNSFTVAVKVTTAAAALTDAPSDAGSGVKSVAYYYCAGYAGSCTTSTGTLIGSSTNAGTNYAVTWTGQPVDGAYRVVAVVTDNVGNVLNASASMPVSVSN